MAEIIKNTLKVYGPDRLVKGFIEYNALEFETPHEPAFDWLHEIAQEWPELSFLLEYQDEANEIQGVAFAKGARMIGNSWANIEEPIRANRHNSGAYQFTDGERATLDGSQIM